MQLRVLTKLKTNLDVCDIKCSDHSFLDEADRQDQFESPPTFAVLIKTAYSSRDTGPLSRTSSVFVSSVKNVLLDLLNMSDKTLTFI